MLPILQHPRCLLATEVGARDGGRRGVSFFAKLTLGDGVAASNLLGSLPRPPSGSSSDRQRKRVNESGAAFPGIARRRQPAVCRARADRYDDRARCDLAEKAAPAHASEHDADQRQRQPAPEPPAFGQFGGMEGTYGTIDAYLSGPSAAAGDGLVARLADGRLPLAQRQALVASAGQIGGNARNSRMIARAAAGLAARRSAADIGADATGARRRGSGRARSGGDD